MEDPFIGGSETTSYSEDGIHENVSLLVTVDKKYPHIEVKTLDGISRNTAKLLAESLSTGRQVVGVSYPVYYRQGGEDREGGEEMKEGGLVELGECHQVQVKMLIRLVGIENLVGRLKDGREVRGQYLYALSK